MKTEIYVPTDLYSDCEFGQFPDLDVSDVIIVDKGTVALEHDFSDTGVYCQNGYLLPESVLLRGTLPDNKASKIHKNITVHQYIDKDVIYIGTGWMFKHFGHFMIEGLARLWPLLYHEYQNMCVVISTEGNPEIPSFIRKILNALGVNDDNIIIVNKNTQFSRVFVPRQSENIGINMLPITRRVVDKIADALGNQDIETYDKIYMSRGAMNDNRTFGERSVEKIFEQNGYKIIYPETLPFEHQVTLANHCRFMAGTAGSALHLALFMRSGGCVIQIKRNTKPSDNINIQRILNNTCGLDTVYVAGSIERFPTDHFTNAPQMIGVTPQMIRFFDEHNFKYNASDTEPDKGEFLRYMHQVRRYKAHVLYTKIFGTPIRLISLFGITKSGQRRIRQTLKRIMRI